MADNMNEQVVEDAENDEEIVDHETVCIEAILGGLGRAYLEPTRENIRSIASGVTELDLYVEIKPICVLCDCINEFQDLESLLLYDNQLSELPDLNLPNLKEIVLENNKFTSYPTALKQHNKIEEIRLQFNEISELPDDLNLPNLKAIGLNYNKLTSYSSALNHHSNLEEIWLENNQITELSADAFKYNFNLKGLSLGRNPLVQVPSCLMHCTGLAYLGLSECKLTSIPEWIGKKLKNLDELYLKGNPDLDELPNSIRFVKQAIINANNEMREAVSNDPDNMEDYLECDRVEAMVQAACDRVWESRRILLTARPGPPPKSKNKYKLRSKTNNCHEVLFGGNEERRKSIIKLILQYLI